MDGHGYDEEAGVNLGHMMSDDSVLLSPEKKKICSVFLNEQFKFRDASVKRSH